MGSSSNQGNAPPAGPPSPTAAPALKQTAQPALHTTTYSRPTSAPRATSTTPNASNAPRPNATHANRSSSSTALTVPTAQPACQPATPVVGSTIARNASILSTTLRMSLAIIVQPLMPIARPALGRITVLLVSRRLPMPRLASAWIVVISMSIAEPVQPRTNAKDV